MKWRLGKRDLAVALAMAGRSVAKEKMALQVNVVKTLTRRWRSDQSY